MPLDGCHCPAFLQSYCGKWQPEWCSHVGLGGVGRSLASWLISPSSSPKQALNSLYSVCDFNVPLCPHSGTSPACHNGKEPFGVSKSRTLALPLSSPVVLSKQLTHTIYKVGMETPPSQGCCKDCLLCIMSQAASKQSSRPLSSSYLESL